VNCFQIVSLTYWSQHQIPYYLAQPCCELLSDCIFDILVTTTTKNEFNKVVLWIAFRLYLWHIGHNFLHGFYFQHHVVNCFQIVSLTYWSQPLAWPSSRCMCCELLSDCIFDILVTTLTSSAFAFLLLWIAFRLYLWHIGHNVIMLIIIVISVVNCFQIVSLTYWSQHIFFYCLICFCCELLSDCIFDILVTTAELEVVLPTMLWIAFRLYLWHIGHN